MSSPLTTARRIVRFGVFELDAYSAELRRAGTRLNLQAQPLQVLKLLLERPGELVTREDLTPKRRTRLVGHANSLRAPSIRPRRRRQTGVFSGGWRSPARVSL